MWHNYFRVFLRDLRRQKVSAAINVAGLALGLCAFLMIGIYVRDEYSWDRHWAKSDRIVRLINELGPQADGMSADRYVSRLAAPGLKDFFSSEIESAARILPRGSRVLVDGEEFNHALYMVDRELLDIFDFDPVAGSLEDVFAEPNRIALSEESAARLFGGEPALGKTLTLVEEGKEDTLFEVTAIYRIPAGNGVLRAQFQNYTPWNDGALTEAQLNGWRTRSTGSYFLLREGVSPQDLVPRLDDFVRQQVHEPFGIPMSESELLNLFRYRFQFIGDIHFNSLVGVGEQSGFQTTVNGFGLIGVLVLAISLANFVILNLARSVERQREVGIRKVAGALRPALFVQFVCEALLLAGFALGLALLLLEMLLPVFATLLATTLDFNLREGSTWLAPAALVLVVGAIGGLYPALVLSRQRPDRVLRPGGQSGTLGVQRVRRLLVGFQFLIATALIIATLVMYLQLAYTRQRDPGFDVHNVVTLFAAKGPGKFAALRNTVSAIAGVEQVALASRSPNTIGGLIFTEELSRGDGAESIKANGYYVDYNFFSIYRMRLLAGRLYDEALDGAREDAQLASPGGASSLVINESTSRALGFPSPADAVGATIAKINGGNQTSPREIIGVIADSQFNSLLEPTLSEVYILQADGGWFLTLKIAPQSMSTIGDDLRRAWREVGADGQAPIDFVENDVQQALDREQKEGRLLLGFSMLAVAVSCLGLYGIVAFDARRRTKEIGIRNVLGGEFRDILALFLTQFGRPVLWANLLAWPLALWAMLRWLERFPYQIDRWWLVLVCLVAGLLVSLIVSLTVSATVFTAAGTRPVQALRYE
jgi:putative ABC transport system permease protein